MKIPSQAMLTGVQKNVDEHQEFLWVYYLNYKSYQIDREVPDEEIAILNQLVETGICPQR